MNFSTSSPALSIKLNLGSSGNLNFVTQLTIRKASSPILAPNVLRALKAPLIRKASSPILAPNVLRALKAPLIFLNILGKSRVFNQSSNPVKDAIRPVNPNNEPGPSPGIDFIPEKSWTFCF